MPNLLNELTHYVRPRVATRAVPTATGPATTGWRGAGLVGQRGVQGCVPGFPVVGVVWRVGGVEQLVSAVGAGSVLGAERRVPGVGQLRGGCSSSAVGPVLGQRGVIG